MINPRSSRPELFTTSGTPNLVEMKKPDGLIEPIQFFRYDVCPHCKAQRIDVFSKQNYSQNYSQAVDAVLRGYTVSYDKYEIRYMKCRACNRYFMMEWNKGFPRPMHDGNKVNAFASVFFMGLDNMDIGIEQFL